MRISFSPQLRNDTLNVKKIGEALIVNGAELDFSRLPDGATLPRSAIDCPWIAGDVQRVTGVLHVPLLLPIAADASEAARFPEPITVTTDGPVELPV